MHGILVFISKQSNNLWLDDTKDYFIYLFIDGKKIIIWVEGAPWMAVSEKNTVMVGKTVANVPISDRGTRLN